MASGIIIPHSSPYPPPPTSSYVDWSNVCSADIEKYQQIIGQCLPFLSPELVNCTDALCSSHTDHFDSYVSKFIALLLDSASQCFPCRSPSFSHSLIGWNDGPAKLKKDANFWYRVWEQAGQPSGVLFEVKETRKGNTKNLLVVENEDKGISCVVNWLISLLEKTRNLSGLKSKTSTILLHHCRAAQA